MSLPDRDSAPSSHAAVDTGLPRIAFFGGSFDPPHLGHLAIARAARTAFQLDTVLFAPVGAQPLKPEGSSAGFEDRLAMTQLAIAQEAGFAVSLADAPRPSGQPNFTLDTLLQLRAEFGPACSLFCLMGADSFAALPRWHCAAEIPFAATLIVASRPGEPLIGPQTALPQGLSIAAATEADRNVSGIEVRAFTLMNQAGERAAFYVLPGLHIDISASEIRHVLRTNVHDGPTLLPEAVRKYIRVHGLYR